MSTHTTRLPPLPPIAASLPAPEPLVSERATTFISAAIILLAGVSALAWSLRLDTTDSQLFVIAAATGTAFTPAAALAILQGRLRR